MKIFNWVHRRFTHHKDGLAQNENKFGLANADETTYDNQFVQESDALPKVFDGWKGGILTIGTFGYDPLKDVIEQNETSFLDQEEAKEKLSALEIESAHQITDSEEDDQEEEEVNPLVFAAYEYDYEGLLQLKMEEINRVSPKDEFELDAILRNNTKKERTTLAELFSADSEDLQKKQPINKEEIIKQNKSNYKHGFSFSKKPIEDEDARPIHKLHQLMSRMLKRKIHPDLGVNRHNPSNSSKVVAKKSEISTETAALLSTQVADAII